MLRYRICSIAALLIVVGSAAGQSGRGSGSVSRTAILNVIVRAPKDKVVTREMFDLYDSGIPQQIEAFAPVETGSNIVLMVDNSLNLKAEPAAVQKAATAVINELFEDDRMMVVGYHEDAEILEDMTPELAKLQTAAGKFVKKGFPRLFDALLAVSDALSRQAKTGIEKRVIILISDGYDSESKTKFEDALATLQSENIILYALQVQDRTRGALLRDKPKPGSALEQLTVGTGGAILPFDKAADSAKTITDDLRNHWYRLVYTPVGVTNINARRLLIIPHEPGIELRTKGSHPARAH